MWRQLSRDAVLTEMPARHRDVSKPTIGSCAVRARRIALASKCRLRCSTETATTRITADTDLREACPASITRGAAVPSHPRAGIERPENRYPRLLTVPTNRQNSRIAQTLRSGPQG